MRPSLRFGWWHGDFTPWNMALDGRRLVLWDWEYAQPASPAGLDLVHFEFQLSFIAGGATVAEALDASEAGGTRHLRGLGLDRDAAAATVRCYHLEVFLRYYGTMLDGVPTNPRFFPAVLDELTGR